MGSISFGGTNSGFEAGVVNGTVNANFYPYAERPETPPAPLSTVPFPRDSGFVSRGTLLEKVDKKTLVPGSRIALVGLGGVGKSQLAIEYCHRVRDRSADTWVFWIHASNKNRFEQSCREIADRVKIPGRQDPQANIFKLLYDWLQDAKNKWILVLDNLDDDQFILETEDRGSAQSSTPAWSIWGYFSQISKGSIIFTSRSRRVALRLVEDDDVIEVNPMDETQAFALFEKKLGAQANMQEVNQLIAALEFMPLAIVQAASYIRRRAPQESVQQYLENFQRSDRQKVTLLDNEGGHLRRDPEAKNSILTSWQISFDYIQRTSPVSADLLSLMSFFDRQGIPDHLLRKNKTQDIQRQSHPEDSENNDINQQESRSEPDQADNFQEDISVLRDFSMISVSMDGKSFEMHRLVQLAMQEWLKSQKLLERWQGDFIQLLSSNFPNGNVENWPTCQLMFSHVLCAMKQQPKSAFLLDEWASLLYRAAWFARERGNYVDGKRMAENSAEVRKDLFSQESSKRLESLEMLGSMLSHDGKWKKAEDIQIEVMKTRNQVLGTEHPDTLTSMHNLALTYNSQGRWKEAEDLELQVMETRKRVLSSENPDALASMTNLSSIYWNQGRWKEAEDLELQVMETRKRVLGSEHPDTLNSMHNLASTYMDQGRWKKAEDLGLQVIETCKRVLGSEHPSTLTSMNNLATTYMSQGRWKEAEDLGLQVMETRKRVLGSEHPETLTSMSNLALTYWSQGRLKEAENLGLQVIETRKRVLGSEHPSTLSSMHNLATTYMSQGRWKEAEDLGLQVMETRKRVLGSEHPSTLTNMDNLATTYWNQGQWKEAEDLGLQVMETRKRVLGSEHPDTLTSMHNLAWILKLSGQHEAAFQLMTACSRSRSRIIGSDHPDTLTSIFNLNEWETSNSDRHCKRSIFSRLFHKR